MISAQSILTFGPSRSSGRGQNDFRNKVREQIISGILNKETLEFEKDPEYGEKWKNLTSSLSKAVLSLDGSFPLSAEMKAGRGFNYDFLLHGQTNNTKVEFKFGAVNVQSLPQFYNAPTTKPFHGVSYPEFYYDNYLHEVAKLFSLEIPEKSIYLKEVRKNKSSHSFFTQLCELEKADPKKKKQKKSIVDKSIHEYLQNEYLKTDIDLVTKELQATQSNKVYLLYKNKDFHTDVLEANELIVRNIVNIHRKNTIVLQTQKDTTTIRMLLRWKNHAGILFPAWQIKLCRSI